MKIKMNIKMRTSVAAIGGKREEENCKFVSALKKHRKKILGVLMVQERF